MKQKSQTKDLSKEMPGPIPAGQNENGCAEAECQPDNAHGHEAPCLHDTPKNDERRNETAVDEDALSALDQREADFLKLVKTAQNELANQRGNDCEFTYSYGDSEWNVYIYREECPEAFFCEFSMFHLLMSYADVAGGNGERWIPYAARAARYLRRLPDDVCNDERAYFYLRAADWYERKGDDNRTLWHRKRGIAYQLKVGRMVLDDIKELLCEMEDNETLHFCLYVMSHICEQGCFGEDEFYIGWNREHYVLVEYLLKTTTEWLVNDEECPVFIRSLILFLKAVYYKRTRRFVLAEAAFDDYLSLPESDEDSCCIISDVVYALLGECYLHDGDKERAKMAFEQLADKDSRIWEYVRSLTSKETLADNLNQDLYDAMVIYCCQYNMTAPYLAEAIDAFFAPPEEYEE